jgi:hypothetical protein
LAPRRLDAAKKRASNGKLASFFSMKVAICCNPCGGECGLQKGTPQSNMRGIGMIE